MSVSFPLIQVALDGLRRWKLDGVDIGSLQRKLAVIQNIYDEAEVKQLTNEAVKLWLDAVKQLLYDVEDILDGFLTELQILKLRSEHHENHPHQTQQGICERFEPKVRDINQKLKSVEKEGRSLGLNSSMGSGSGSSSSPQRPPTSSFMSTRSKFVGRDEETSKILEWLLEDHKTSSPSDKDNNFSVLPIVGMGGSGKTTLAQFVYHHNTVKSSHYFDVKAWVCVSEEFDVVRLTREILKSATRSSEASNSLEELQTRLAETMEKKRFLLVLDDMWKVDQERWEALSSIFEFGKAGSKILVTTRNKGVASIVGTVPIHDLKPFSNDHCSALFKKHAFMDENSSDAKQKWKVFGQEILEKCKGLPLAAKTLASLLRDKRANWEWKKILENELWYSNERDGILPSIMLSYNHLPPPLKRCFQYCALFPKDYVFNKIELVVLWMAEGIVQPRAEGEQKQRVEDIGAAYFDELFMRSLFELSDLLPAYSPFDVEYYIGYEYEYVLPDEIKRRSFFESSSGNIESGYVMHDLIHDLAQSVSGGMFCKREEHDNKSSEVRTTTRHLSFSMENFDFEAIESEATKRLRTIFYLNMHITQFQFQFLRVLRVWNVSNHELPDSIGEMKQLRLLDLSYSIHLVRLPDSVTSLYNLQTLNLFGCDNLNELPEDIGKLVNLRHFSLPTMMLKHDYLLPLGVGNLRHLQSLIPSSMGSKNSRVLKDLSQLHGILEITHLENLGNINVTEPVVSNLKNKPHVVGLCLHWSAYESEADSFPDLGRDEKREEDVLDQLQPHTNLQLLQVENYGGTRFPSWMEYLSCFSNLEAVILVGCYKCKILPHLQQLPLLKHLVIRGCNDTKMVGSELCGFGSSSSSAIKQFRTLETLTIAGMKEWEEWAEVVEESEEGGGQFPCLLELSIKECPKLRELPRLLPTLQVLYIIGSPKLVVYPCLPFNRGIRNLSTLRLLKIDKCPALVSIPKGMLPINLREFHIRNCPNLESLHALSDMSSLEVLIIRNCPLLTRRYQMKEGEEWSEISQIPEVIINSRRITSSCSQSGSRIDYVSSRLPVYI